MSKEDNLDLSKISVSELLDDKQIPSTETTEETPEAVETETPTAEETSEETTEETSEETQEDDTEAEAPNNDLQETADTLEQEGEGEESEASKIGRAHV